jgi:hypothetical protein
MVRKGVPVHIAELIYKSNKHNPILTALGILPNQLRSLLKGTTPSFDDAFVDISSTLVQHSYQIWKLRKALLTRYWKKIAREEWKPHPDKKRLKEKKECVSAFHFLQRHCNLSKQSVTICICSRPVYKTQDIRSFLLPTPQQRHRCTDNNTSILNPPTFNYQTREDNVRGEHDRSKISQKPLTCLLAPTNSPPFFYYYTYLLFTVC